MKLAISGLFLFIFLSSCSNQKEQIVEQQKTIKLKIGSTESKIKGATAIHNDFMKDSLQSILYDLQEQYDSLEMELKKY